MLTAFKRIPVKNKINKNNSKEKKKGITIRKDTKNKLSHFYTHLKKKKFKKDMRKVGNISKLFWRK